MRIVRELPASFQAPRGARPIAWGSVRPPDALSGRLDRFRVPAALRRAFPTALALVLETRDKRRKSWRKYPTQQSIDPELTPGLDTETDDGLRRKRTWHVMYTGKEKE
jgi:hypothetical protein